MKIALAMIVKGTDEEAMLLERCLDSFTYDFETGKKLKHAVVDGIFITRTHKKGEEPNETVKKIAEGFGAVVSDFEWCNDFAKARNYNFSQVPKDYDYILWTDADDVWRGLDKLRPTLEEHPHMDAFGFNYLYDWDEFKNPTVVHRKTMLVKNDGCVSWVGELHEDLQENRALEVQIVTGIERLHLTTKERAEDNAKRNVEIASKQVTDNPDDPRSFWNLANSQYGVGDYKGALESFEHFLEDSESEDEKYLAYERLSDVCRMLEEKGKAIQYLQIAIGLKPSLPDAYLQLAQIYFSYANYDKAEEYSIQGMVRRPQPDRMIVFNPRDYDYNPMMLLAKVYYQKNRPDLMLPLLEGCLKIYPQDKHIQDLVREGKEEKDAMAKAIEHVQTLQKITDKVELKKELDKLPESIKSHPMVCALRNTNFIKEESSGKDLVIYCGNTTHQWNPQLFKEKGFGGSEEAVIHLAREWAKLGWNVTVYNNCGHKPYQEFVTTVADDNFDHPLRPITYHPFWEWNYRDKQDVTILWRWTKPLDAEINSTKIFVDLHDVVPPGEFTEKRLNKVDKIFVKTQFHRSLFPSVPDDKIAVIPNGFEPYYDPSIKKDPMLVINTSSPDRSMDVLPKLWKQVKEQVPGARLAWCYGWDVYKAAHSGDPKKIAWMESVIKEMDEAGIEQLGKLPQAEVGKLYQEASFLAYPTEFAEISCISALKAQAAKCIPVATDFGALRESIKYGVMVHSDKTKDNWSKPYQFHFGLEGEQEQQEWVDMMIGVLIKSHSEWTGLDEWVEGYKWENVAKRWNEIFEV